jgi:hypothetical protein
MHLLRWSVVGLAAVAMPSIAGATAYVLGDSIGEGVAIASGLKGLAKISVHIRGPKAIAQINQTPPGSTVFIVLGTNDADGSIKNIGKSIDDVVAAADRRQLNMIWIGPHCVRKAWDTRARELDEILRAKLASTSVKYVSMRDARFCGGNFHEPDGVHLTMSGYRYMWDKARASAGVPASGTRATAQKAAPEGGEAAATAPAAPAPSVAAAAPPAPAAPSGDRTAGAVHRIVMEVHVPPAAPSTSLVWVRVGDYSPRA